MYWVNKIAYLFLCPTAVAIALLIVAYWTRRLGWLIGATLWLWLCASAIPARTIGVWLESRYPPAIVEEVPQADAVVVLGGGVSFNEEAFPYPDMAGAADRVWHAARLWKAGKAPIVILSGSGSDRADAVLLHDFGVPDGAIKIDAESKNTQGNAVKTRSLLPESAQKILLVTSAWHMRRAEAVFSQNMPNIQTFPVAVDYSFSAFSGKKRWFYGLVPDTGFYNLTSILFKELLGRIGSFIGKAVLA